MPFILIFTAVAVLIGSVVAGVVALAAWDTYLHWRWHRG